MYRSIYLEPKVSMCAMDYDSFTAQCHSGKIQAYGHIGPEGGTANDSSPRTALRKAISEALDRRSSMIGFHSQRKVPTFDLITHRVTLEPLYKFSLNSDTNNFVDTTGSSAHFISSKAVYNSVVELFQKNSFFLIWYLGRFQLVKQSNFNVDNYRVFFLVNLDFMPYYNVLACELTEDRKSFFGMGTATNLEDAIKISKSELDLLKYANSSYNFFSKKINMANYSMGNETQFLYISKLIEHAKLLNQNLRQRSLIVTSQSLVYPRWITNLQIAILPNHLFPGLKVTKVISSNLISYLPIKELLLENKDFYKLPFHINIEDIIQSPDCPNL